MFEFTGFLFSVGGSLALALGKPRVGWPVFFVANVAWVGFALEKQAYWLLLQNVVFIGTTGLGLYNTFIRKR